MALNPKGCVVHEKVFIDPKDWEDGNHMPLKGSVRYIDAHDKPFSSWLPLRFNKMGTKAPCGADNNGNTLYQYYVWDTTNDQTLFVTEEDFHHKDTHTRQLALKYCG